ncbi:MAG: 5-formyltetrahydrofolate cyclo-ligase, partial [Steroidobacteraceae bacterium]
GPAERSAAEQAIAATLARLHIFSPGKRVAVYLAMRGEVDLAPTITVAWRAGALLYAPRITSRRRREIAFVPLARGEPTRTGAFGIAEPLATAGMRLPVLRLDTVLLPVVGFDGNGNRLGMGAGFYDRALRGRRRSGTAWRRPRLVGVAFACQQLPGIEPSPWDVALDMVVTESGIIRPGRRAPDPHEAS